MIGLGSCADLHMNVNFVCAFPGAEKLGNGIETSNKFGLAPSPCI